ncbi:hypothetical protein ABIB40_000002 [Pedobacter sp. UYP30]|uniref:hypothetical protein n=1 Tax=Pedobacter sp. UYP30 TaxID=1756400 RepID=UPI00339976B1
MFFTKELDKRTWKYLMREDEILEILKRGLPVINDKLTLTTTLKDLMEIYCTEEHFENLYNQKSTETAKRLFKKDLLKTLKSCNNGAEIRKIGYRNAIREMPLQLIDLGYMFINMVCDNSTGVENFVRYQFIPFPNHIPPILAEGVGIALFLADKQNKQIFKGENLDQLLEPKFILGLNEVQISKSYKHFKQHFEKPIITYKDYFDCFNENITPKPFKLIKGQNKYFNYFLSIAGANDRIASKRFGIKQFDNVKSRNKKDMKTETVFVNQMKAILNK